MDKELLRNGEGYVDYTAYQAISKADKETDNMEIYAGDIMIAPHLKTGGDREYIVLAVHDRIATVLMLNTDEELPCSCKGSTMKYYHPGYLQYIFLNIFTGFVRTLTDSEFTEVKQNVADALSIDCIVKEVVKEVPVEVIKEVQVGSNAELMEAKAESKVYKDMYERLLARVMGDKT